MELFSLQKIKNKVRASDGRTLKAQKNILYSLIIKGISIGIGLVFIPLTIDYINPERYGIWLTLSSVITWFNFFDFGLGNGLRNKLAIANAKEDIKEENKLISTTYITLLIISIFIILAYSAVRPFLNWSILLGVSLKYSSELNKLAFLLIAMFCIQFILQLINTINNAYQKSSLVSLSYFVGNVISLMFIIILKYTVKGSLLWLGVALFTGNILALLFLNIKFFLFDRKELFPKYRSFSFEASRELLGLGGKFFVIQIAGIIQYQTTNLLISRYMSSIQVTQYNVAYKFFGMLTMVFSIIVGPIWSAVTEAFVKEDYNWIRNTKNKLVKIWLILVLVGILLLIFSSQIYRFWLSNSVKVPFNISVGVMLYIYSSTFSMIYVNILNGLGRLKIQYYLSIVSMIIYIPFSYFLAVTLEWGVLGICIALIICNVNGLIAAPLEYKRIIHKRVKNK